MLDSPLRYRLRLGMHGSRWRKGGLARGKGRVEGGREGWAMKKGRAAAAASPSPLLLLFLLQLIMMMSMMILILISLASSSLLVLLLLLFEFLVY